MKYKCKYCMQTFDEKKLINKSVCIDCLVERIDITFKNTFKLAIGYSLLIVSILSIIFGIFYYLLIQ